MRPLVVLLNDVARRLAVVERRRVEVAWQTALLLLLPLHERLLLVLLTSRIALVVVTSVREERHGRRGAAVRVWLSVGTSWRSLTRRRG